LRAAAALAFFGLLAALWLAARTFGVAPQLTPTTIAAVAMLIAPFWAFGFGLADALPKSPYLPVILVASYPLFALPRGIFRWDMFLGMAAVVLAVGLLLARGHHWIVLAILGISVDLRFFDAAWPVPGLNSMTKLLFVDAGLYGFLLLHPIGDIGYDFRPRLRDLGIGLREFLFFTPIAIALGFGLSFLHAHKTIPAPTAAAVGWIFTLFFIAVPEELFFRGLLLNLLKRKIGVPKALIVSSLLFGLAHFNKRDAYFNWRYVIIAAIAGFFYGRAWLDRRRILTSSITHATVDTVWSIWLR
jgi:hypothetical protein